MELELLKGGQLLQSYIIDMMGEERIETVKKMNGW